MDYVCCAGASVAFVASFYVWPRERRFVFCGVRSLRRATQDSSIYIDRDSAATIRRRSFSLLLNCVLSCAFLAFRTTSSPAISVVRQHQRLLCTARAATSTIVLFTGPIVDKLLLRSFTVEESWLQCWRSYFLCPIGEELFFRGVLFSILRYHSSWAQISVAALLFALSHTHHVVSWACDEYLDRVAEAPQDDGEAGVDIDAQRACWRAAMRKLGFVYGYTGAFGGLSGYYYLRICNGSISAVAVVHSICNFLGPPDFALLRSSFSSPLAKTVGATAYVIGIVGWAWLLLH